MSPETIEFNLMMSSQIDRLVASELNEEERRRLVEWCDAEPQRWRQCALAFLEAQTWQEALRGWPQVDGVNNFDRQQQIRGESSNRKRFDWKVLAASILIAFICGLLLRPPQNASTEGPLVQSDRPATNDSPTTSSPPEPTQDYITVSVRTDLSPAMATLQLPVAKATSAVAAKPGLPEHVKRQWEKRGYEVAAAERFLKGQLPDGRDVVVPVSGLQVRYVGKPVY